jgi:ferrochelatase
MRCFWSPSAVPNVREDVIPFLDNVLRGRNVPRERLLEVAEHYDHLGGRSPINAQCRELIAALRAVIDLPIYWGNRNWDPLLPDTLRQMKNDGVRRALAIATSAYSSYSGCRQYIESIAAACPDGLVIDKLPPFSGHPKVIEANADRVRAALDRLPDARIVYTAHSIPIAMASTCRYEQEVREGARRISEAVSHSSWDIAWQSRSGPPSQPWLAPDIFSHLRTLASSGVTDVVVAPIGFLSDHMEVVYDLDHEAASLARDLGLNFVRARTVGTHPAMIAMLKELIEQRKRGEARSLCPEGCCRPTLNDGGPGTAPYRAAASATRSF